MLRVEALNLIDASATFLGQVGDVHVSVAQNISHGKRRVPEAIDTANAVGHRIVPKDFAT
jgi:hypothetical protein